MSDIPPEIIRDIISHLPVKSLLRFRCVSKPWLSMIDAKDFTKLHLHNSHTTHYNGTLLVDAVEVVYLDLDSFECLIIRDTQQPERSSLTNSCNGLVLIVLGHNNTVLWNPAMRKSQKLPSTPLTLECNILDSILGLKHRFALGYDSKHDDYKVVRVIQGMTFTNGGCLNSETKIYSLKSNSWKKVEDLPFVLIGSRWVCLNDALHTVAENIEGSEVIMAFDLVNEKYYEVPKPSGVGDLASVHLVGGCLMVVVPREDKKNMSEVWVMKEYGVKESWAKLLCFEPPLGEPCLNLCPLAYSKNGDEILLNYNRMCLNWYDLKKKKTISMPCVSGLTALINESPDDAFFHVDFCVKSLVSPHSPAGLVSEQQPTKGKETKKKRDDFLSAGFKLKL